MKLRDILILVAVFLCCACADEGVSLQQGGFYLAISDDATVTTRTTPSEAGVPTAAQFSLNIVNEKTGRVAYTGAYKAYVQAGNGDYLLTATCGEDVVLGINTPYYYGEAHASITATELKPSVTIPCHVANSLLSVRYVDKDGNASTARFDNNFSQYAIRVVTDNRYVELFATHHSAYFRAGTMPKVYFVGVLAATGREVEYEIPASSLPASLEAAEHLILSLSLEVQPSSVVLEVARAEVEKVTIEDTLPLEWLPAPKMDTYGGETTFMRYEDEEAPTNLSYTLTTATGVQDVELTIDCADGRLSALNGTRMLSQMSAEEQQTLAGMGFALPVIGAVYSGQTFDNNKFVANLRTNDGAVTRNSIGVRVKANDRWTSETANSFYVEVKRLRFTLPAQAESNAWSTTLYIDPVTAANVVAGNGVDVDDVVSGLRYEVSSDDGKTWTTLSTVQEGTQLKTTGLSSGTTYKLRAKMDGHTLYSNQATQTMETPAEVPNGDFETLTTTYDKRTINQGGQYTRTRLGSASGPNTQTFTVGEPTGWGSTNAKTCNLSASTVNSWFCPLSVFNTSIAFQTNEAKIGGLGGNTIKPAIYCNQTAQHGDNAMVVRNVAYSANGTVPSTYKNTAATPGNNYYSKNAPTISNTAAGKLFLGGYTFSGGTETFNEGISFASRPTVLTGYYKYNTSKGNSSDKGSVTVTLLNGSTTIATGTVSLSSADNYTQFTVPLTYSNTMAKATSLRIMICSATNENNITTTKFTEYIQEAYGSVLCVDNLTFTYDR